MRVTLGFWGSRVQLIMQIMEVQEEHWEPGLLSFLLLKYGLLVKILGP